jgi:hypothetical protein
MKVGKAGEYKRAAQAVAEKRAAELARSIWRAFWKKHEKRLKAKRARSAA